MTITIETREGGMLISVASRIDGEVLEKSITNRCLENDLPGATAKEIELLRMLIKLLDGKKISIPKTPREIGLEELFNNPKALFLMAYQ